MPCWPLNAHHYIAGINKKLVDRASWPRLQCAEHSHPEAPCQHHRPNKPHKIRSQAQPCYTLDPSSYILSQSNNSILSQSNNSMEISWIGTKNSQIDLINHQQGDPNLRPCQIVNPSKPQIICIITVHQKHGTIMDWDKEITYLPQKQRYEHFDRRNRVKCKYFTTL